MTILENLDIINEGVLVDGNAEQTFTEKASKFKTKAKKKGIQINMQSATVVGRRRKGNAAALEVVCKIKGKDKLKSIPIECTADYFKDIQKWALQNSNKYVSLFKKAPIIDKEKDKGDKDKMLEDYNNEIRSLEEEMDNIFNEDYLEENPVSDKKNSLKASQILRTAQKVKANKIVVKDVKDFRQLMELKKQRNLKRLIAVLGINAAAFAFFSKRAKKQIAKDPLNSGNARSSISKANSGLLKTNAGILGSIIIDDSSRAMSGSSNKAVSVSVYQGKALYKCYVFNTNASAEEFKQILNDKIDKKELSLKLEDHHIPYTEKQKRYLKENSNKVGKYLDSIAEDVLRFDSIQEEINEELEENLKEEFGF